MKKLSVAALLIAFGAIALFGCAKKEEDMVYLKDFDATKYVELGEYKGLSIDVDKVEVTDAEVEDYAQYYLSSNSKKIDITDRDEAKNGDIANIDYVGKKDGVAFDGGSAEGFDLTLGSATFIPGFEEGVVGMKVGETKDIDLTFPEAYGNEELAGQAVVFTVTLNGLKENQIPELNDEFVKQLAASIGASYQTVDEFKVALREELETGYKTEQDAKIEEQLETKLKEQSTFKEAPSGMVDRLLKTLLETVSSAATDYGVEPGMIASYYYGVESDNYEENLRNYVKETLAPQYLMIGAVAKKEGIKITDEMVDEEIQKLLDAYGATYTIDEYKEKLGDLEAFREYILVNKVVEVMRENAVINEN